MLNKALTLCFACFLLASMNSMAVTNKWIGASSGNWTNDASWDQGTVPTASEEVWHVNNSNTISVTTAAAANSLLVGHNGTSIVAVVTNGSLTVGGVAEIGNAGTDGTGILFVDGGSVSIGGNLDIGRFGVTRKGIGELNSGSIAAGGDVALGGFNAAPGTLTINGGTFTATNGIFYISRTGDGTLNMNGGILQLDTSGTVFNPLRVGDNNNVGNGTINLNGGAIYTGGFQADYAETDSGTATIYLNAGLLQVEGAFVAAARLEDDAQMVFDAGVFKWKGNQLSSITNFVAGGFINWTNGGTSMLTENWEHSWTNGTSILYADYNDATSGYTTVWAFDTAAEQSGYSAFSNQYALTQGPLGDDDNDGLMNFGEYALNGNPTNAADTGRFAISTDGTFITFVHSKLANDTSVVYRVLNRTNLLSGAVNTNQWTTQTFGSAAGDYLTVSNHFSTVGMSESFFYLEVEEN